MNMQCTRLPDLTFSATAFRALVLAYFFAVAGVAQTDQAELHFRIAEAALKKGDLEVAVEELEAAIKFAPSNAVLYYNLAEVQSKQHQPFKARTNLDKAFTLGLSAESKDAALDLRASLAYELRNKADIAAFVGRWLGKYNWAGTTVSYDHTECTTSGTTIVTLSVKKEAGDSEELRGELTRTEQNVHSRGNCEGFVKGSRQQPDATFSITGTWNNELKAVKFDAAGSSSWHGALILDGDSIVLHRTGGAILRLAERLDRVQ